MTKPVDFDDDLTPSALSMMPKTLHETAVRLVLVERTLTEHIKSSQRVTEDAKETRRWMRNATLALVTAMIGAVLTTSLAGIGAAVAYGELRGTIHGQGDTIARLEGEVRDLRGAMARGQLSSPPTRP
jgi:hypothetical protein